MLTQNLRKSLHELLIELNNLNNAMPRYIRSAINKTTGEQKTIYAMNCCRTKRFCTAKIQHSNLKAPSSNVKIQSDNTFATQIYFFVATNQIRHGNKSTKRTNNKVKF